MNTEVLHTIQVKGTEFAIRKMPPTIDAAGKFLAVEREVYSSTYVGLPCNKPGYKNRTIQQKDMAAFFKPNQAADLATMMNEPFVYDKNSTVLLEAVDLKTNTTIGVVNVKTGPATHSPEQGTPATAKLHEVDVLPAFQGFVGTKLFESALDIVSGLQVPDATILLHAQTHNPYSNWYTSIGMKPTGKENQTFRWPNGVTIAKTEYIGNVQKLRTVLKAKTQYRNR